MPSHLLTPPANEPVTLDEARAFLRIEHHDDDDLIAALIAGARIQAEAQTRRAFITQSWRLSLDAWPEAGRLSVTPAPLQSVSVARVYDEAGVAQDIDVQAFIVDAAGAALVFAPWTLPSPGRAAGIEIDVLCGYGGTALDVPEPLRQAVRLMTAHWYENRGGTDAGAPLPLTVAGLLAPHRVLSL